MLTLYFSTQVLLIIFVVSFIFFLLKKYGSFHTLQVREHLGGGGGGGGGVKLATAFLLMQYFQLFRVSGLSCMILVLLEFSCMVSCYLEFGVWRLAFGIWHLAFGICLMFELWSVMVLGFLFSEIGVCTSEMAEVIFRQVSCFS